MKPRYISKMVQCNPRSLPISIFWNELGCCISPTAGQHITVIHKKTARRILDKQKLKAGVAMFEKAVETVGWGYQIPRGSKRSYDKARGSTSTRCLDNRIICPRYSTVPQKCTRRIHWPTSMPKTSTQTYVCSENTEVKNVLFCRLDFIVDFLGAPDLHTLRDINRA